MKGANHLGDFLEQAVRTTGVSGWIEDSSLVVSV